MQEKQRNAPRTGERFPTIPKGTLVTLERSDLDKNKNMGAPTRITGVLESNLGMGRNRYLKVAGSGFFGVVKALKNQRGRLSISVVDVFEESSPKPAYEYALKSHESSHTLSIENKYGKINLPSDARGALLDDEVVDINLGDEVKIYINKPALKGILLEVHGGEIFWAGRMMLVAQVGNIHLPFYISGFGTSGKPQGAWYPFFGCTKDSWFIKRDLSEEKHYPQILRVQDILNKNLVLPTKFLTPSGKIDRKELANETDPSIASFDLREHIKYQDIGSTEFPDTKSGGEAFIQRITGYEPQQVSLEDPMSAHDWMDGVLSQIKTREIPESSKNLTS